MVEWREIVTGTIIGIVLTIIFGLLIGTYGTYIGISFAGFITGLIIDNEIIEWLISGFCVGIFTGILLALTAFILTLVYGASAGFGAGLLGGSLLIGAELYLVLSYIIISMITTFIGALISKGIPR